ncbi:MAG: alpha/beta hydrolase [Actinomycetota bacterium]|nr:alpha/beta hydrolase [Actinomycetota bacterium]
MSGDERQSDVREGKLSRPDGRTVAWTEYGDTDGFPVVRVPGTPGSRWSVYAKRAVWAERGIRVITTERPGYGASTRLPGRRFAEHAHDLDAVLAHLGIERAAVYGGSGGAPHVLALAAHHPERVLAATVLAGASPLLPDEVGQMIPLNQEAHALGVAGDHAGLVALLEPHRQAMLADPLGAFREIMATAPEGDREVMADPVWQATFARATTEALGQGAEGWADEGIAMQQPWGDIPLVAITTSVQWFHTASDRNTPLSAAQRLVTRLPDAVLTIWPDGGHLAGYHREGDVLDELLARARAA